MNNLLEHAYNSFMHYMGLLNNGRTDWDSAVIFNAILLIKTGISDKKYIQYYESNLLEPVIYKLDF